MEKWKGFQKGVNLGGWLSQCSMKKEHLEFFIGESDIRKISEWGCDHVRLPFDYEILQDEDGNLKPDAFLYIDRCVSWCEKYGLNVVLDLHKPQGYIFSAGTIKDYFLHNEKIIVQFLNVWIAISKRYGTKSENIAFDLINFIVKKEEFSAWMNIAKSAVSVIRVFAPYTKIIVSGHTYGHVLAIPEIENFYDENIVYGFHCYEPTMFTHQNAYWTPYIPQNIRVEFPEESENYLAKMTEKDAFYYRTMNFTRPDLFGDGYFEKLFENVVEFAESRGSFIYCEEFGAIENAPKDSTVKWFQAIHGAFEKFGIGRAVWTYKEMDFGLTNSTRDEIRDEIIKCL